MQGPGRASAPTPTPLRLPEFTGPCMRDVAGPLGSTAWAWGVPGFLPQKLPCDHRSGAFRKTVLSPLHSGRLMAVEQAPGEGGAGRRILAEERCSVCIQEPQRQELLMCLL